MISTIYLQFHIHLLTESANLPFLSRSVIPQLYILSLQIYLEIPLYLAWSLHNWSAKLNQSTQLSQPIRPAQSTNPPILANQSAQLSHTVTPGYLPPLAQGGVPPCSGGGPSAGAGKPGGVNPPGSNASTPSLCAYMLILRQRSTLGGWCLG